MSQLSTRFHSLALTFSTKGIISSVSSGAEQITGYSAQDLISCPITRIFADHSAFEIPQIMESAKEWGVWEGGLVLVDRSGSLLRAKSSVLSLQTLGDHQAGYLMCATLSRQGIPDSEEAGLLQEVGVQLRMLSHEMNNPLAVIMGFMQLVMLSPQCAGKLRTDMEKINSEMTRVVQVVEKLHQYALSLQEETAQSHGSMASMAS
jgi:PAS domain S-box-containing protein